MKVALCQIDIVAKRPDLNAQKAIAMLEEAASNGAKVVVFPELTIPGYMLGDLWEDRSFLNEVIDQSLEVLDVSTRLGVSVIFGTTTDGDSFNIGEKNYEDGRPQRFNSAVTATPERCYFYNKTNRANYREFDDKRYFEKGNGCPHPFMLDGTWTTTSICEDGWDDDYPEKPISVARDQLPGNEMHVHFNLSCSPYTKGKNGARNRRFSRHSEFFTALCYVNCVGSQNNGKNVFVFDGSTTVYARGKLLGSLPPLKECIGYFEQIGDTVTLQGDNWLPTQEDPSLAEVLVYGTKKFLEQNGLKRVVIGLSGGIDSALSAMIHVKALGPENVILVNMPTEFNSETTKGIAAEIAKNLGCPYMVVPIGSMCDTLSHVLFSQVSACDMHSMYKEDLENIAARMRGAGVQAALAAGLKAVFPNNGNKSETAVGYCTMAGDHMGYLAPIADLWKTEVYEVSKAMSEEMGGILPDSIFTLKPSAELSADHNVDQGKGDPLAYWYHDKLLASWEEPWERKSIEDSLEAYKENQLLQDLGLELRSADFLNLFPTPQAFIDDMERWWKLFTGMAVIKRVQSPPIVVVSRRAFGYDFRESIGSQGFTQRYLNLKKELLG
jgi:NAD+ synthase (glutamine-hydrolysing)